MLLGAGGMLPFDFPQYMNAEHRQLPSLGWGDETVCPHHLEVGNL